MAAASAFIPLSGVAGVVPLLGIVASIFIGFRNSNAVNRWSEARTLWGAMVANCQSISNALVAVDEGSPEMAATLDRMRRRQVRHAWQVAQRNRLGLLAVETDLPLIVLLPPTRSARWHGLGDAIPAGRGGILPVLPLNAALDAVAGCSVLVGVDGGMMHAAVGFGRPTVGLFGPTDPRIWFRTSKVGYSLVMLIEYTNQSGEAGFARPDLNLGIFRQT